MKPKFIETIVHGENVVGCLMECDCHFELDTRDKFHFCPNCRAVIDWSEGEEDELSKVKFELECLKGQYEERVEELEDLKKQSKVDNARFQISVIEERNRFYEKNKKYLDDYGVSNRSLMEQLEKTQKLADELRKQNNELYIQAAQLARKLQNERLRTVELNTINAAIKYPTRMEGELR